MEFGVIYYTQKMSSALQELSNESNCPNEGIFPEGCESRVCVCECARACVHAWMCVHVRAFAGLLHNTFIDYSLNI